MGGNIRLSGRAIPPTGLIPFFITYITDSTQIFGISESPGQDPQVIGGLHDVFTGDDAMDPKVSPDGNWIVFSTTAIGAGASQVFYISTDGSSINDAGTVIATNTSSFVVTMFPSWHPTDSDLVVYRTFDDSPNECLIRTVIPSVGSGSAVTLRSVSRATGNVYRPTYNFDGSLIAYAMTSERKLYTMAADGSGSPTLVATLSGSADWQGGWDYCWDPTQDVLYYQDMTGSFPTGDTLIKKVNADGTGTTTLYTDTNLFWGLTLYPVSPDGSTLYYFSNDGFVGGEKRLYAVDTAGGGGAPVAGDHTGEAGYNDTLAYVYGDRVYWKTTDDTDVGPVVSVALDGSGLRTEFNVEDIPVGDVGGSDPEWYSAFYYRLNQPS